MDIIRIAQNGVFILNHHGYTYYRRPWVNKKYCPGVILANGVGQIISCILTNQLLGFSQRNYGNVHCFYYDALLFCKSFSDEVVQITLK